jgi:hypothetical protein
MTSLRTALHAWRRPALPLALGTLALTLACNSNITLTEPGNAAGDPASTTSPNSALFDPSASVIPLPNLLLTGAAGPVTPVAGVPLAPNVALAYINQKEVGSTGAVAGVNAPIYLAFAAPVDPASVAAGGVKIFQVLPDANGLTEVGPVGFRDISALFDLEMLEGGKAMNLYPKVALTPGSRYAYFVTTKLKDVATAKPVGHSVAFGILKYVKPGGTSATTNLADLTDPNNPARLVGQASATSLESIRGNVLSSGVIALSGYGKTLDDVIASATADASGKAASGAGPTGIASRAEVSLMGRFITTGAGAVVPDPLASTSVRAPVETSLWAWANNANVPLSATPAVAMNFSTGESRAWGNGVTISPTGTFIGAAAVTTYYTALGAATAPRSAVGAVFLGTFQSADLNMDPAVVAATTGKPFSGDLTGTTGVYRPGSGAGSVPGTGVLQASRNATGQLRGYYHTTRDVPFVFLAPAGTAPVGGWPVLIFQHGLGGRKEQVVAMANTACASGYAVIAIDIVLHGELGNSAPAADWSPNFISLPSALNTRTNLQNAGFHLWRMERVLKQPSFDPSGFQAKMAAAGFPVSAAGASRYVGISLGSIVGTYFLAGNSAQTGGSNMKAFLSVPGSRLAYVLRDSPTFSPTINAGLAAAGVPTGSAAYNQFMTLTQSVVDSCDPAYMTFPISSVAPSRLSGRVLVQEAIGDTVIPNSHTRYYANSLGGRGILGAPFDTAPGFAQVRFAAATAPTVPFLLGPGGLKPSLAPAADTASGPTEGYFQFGSPTTAATHGMLLDGTANTPLVQKQLAIWLLFGRVIDPTDTAHWPIAPTGDDVSEVLRSMPSIIDGPFRFPKLDQ